MKNRNLFILIFSCALSVLTACGGSGTGESPDIIVKKSLTSSENNITFESTRINQVSTAKSIALTASNVTSLVNVNVSTDFEISKNNTDFFASLNLTSTELNQSNFMLYVRFSPQSSLDNLSGNIVIASNDFSDVTITLSGQALAAKEIQITGAVSDFGDVSAGALSDVQSIQLSGLNLTGKTYILASSQYQISTDNNHFSETIEFSANELNATQISLYIRFVPEFEARGIISHILTFNSEGALQNSITLSGTAIDPVRYNYSTFDKQRLAFGGEHKRSQNKIFDLPEDLSNIRLIKMYVKLDCPSVGCNAWDVFANVKVKDPESGQWFELGRYITPYGVDNSQVDKGFEIDVTDFKSLLQGPTELQVKVDTWGSDGWQVSVNFDYIEGQPDYQYYEISHLLNFMSSSTAGVPYGKAHSFDLDKNILISESVESVSLRTIISGWGHATPVDADNRGCAEWCFRTHKIKINQQDTFAHELGPIGCAENPVSPQSGNWTPDRAGWCPGMAVPVRIDSIDSAISANSFSFEYEFQDWITDGGSTSGNPGAYYAISSYLVVKSNMPIINPTITD